MIGSVGRILAALVSSLGLLLGAGAYGAIGESADKLRQAHGEPTREFKIPRNGRTIFQFFDGTYLFEYGMALQQDTAEFVRVFKPMRFVSDGNTPALFLKLMKNKNEKEGGTFYNVFRESPEDPGWLREHGYHWDGKPVLFSASEIYRLLKQLSSPDQSQDQWWDFGIGSFQGKQRLYANQALSQNAFYITEVYEGMVNPSLDIFDSKCSRGTLEALKLKKIVDSGTGYVAASQGKFYQRPPPPSPSWGEWDYEIVEGKALVTRFRGGTSPVLIPREFDGYPFGGFSGVLIKWFEKYNIEQSTDLVHWVPYGGGSLTFTNFFDTNPTSYTERNPYLRIQARP